MRIQSMLPLVLSASKAAWQAPTPHGNKKWNPVLHAAVSKRFKDTCQYCGWVDSEFNEVSHLDEDHFNNNEENLVLACPLCHQCLHLGKATTLEGGQMIWAAELSQVELNSLARVYWIMQFMTNADQAHPLMVAAHTLVNKLVHQSHILEAHYMPGASDPSFWAEVLMKMTPEQYMQRNELLKNIKVWPALTRFKKMVQPWAKRVNVNLPFKDWERLASGVAKFDNKVVV